MRLKLITFFVIFSTLAKVAYAEEPWVKLNSDLKYYSQIITTSKGLVLGENDGRLWLNPPPFNGLYISKDFGITWQELGLQSKGVTDLAFSGNRIYASTYYINNGNVGLFKSDNYGGSWEQIGPNFSASTVSVSGDTVYLGGFSHGLWVSSDKGATWVQKMGSGFYGPKINLIKSYRNYAIVSTDSEVFFSDDAGISWRHLVFFDSKDLSSAVFTDSSIFVVTRAEGKVYISSNNGITWNRLENLTSFKVTTLNYFNARLYAGIENPIKVTVSKDFGNTWRDIEGTINNDSRIKSISTVMHKKIELFALTAQNNLYKKSQAFEGPEINAFMRIPWNYHKESDLVTNIYSFFDHEYPLLGYSYYKESDIYRNSTLNYMGVRDREPNMYYSSHDGYDFTLPYGTSIDAAAEGIARYQSCTACGNTIVIDHQNGYQTTYMHLQSSGLVVKNNETTTVAQGQQIGLVGMTGNTTGPHLHFAVTKTNVGIPENRIDPFAWENQAIPDPWEALTWTDSNGHHSGTKSIYLWQILIPYISKYITDNADTMSSENILIETPQDSLSKYYTITIKPYGIPTQNMWSYVPETAFLLNAYDNFGQRVDKFAKPLTIRVKLTELNKYVIESLALFFWNDITLTWEKLPSEINTNTQELISQTDHLSMFAVMGSLNSPNAPETTLTISNEPINGWHNTFPTVTLYKKNASDRTFYSLGIDESWELYTTPILISSEGINILKYRSLSEDEVVEEVQTKLIKVDTKNMWANTVTIKDSVYEITAPPSTISP